MALSKEALVIVLDVGPSMSSSSCLSESLQVIKLILQRKLFSESKDEVMFILYGTHATKNDLHDGDEYANISVEKSFSPVTFELIGFVQDITPDARGVSADFIDALVVAMDELKKYTEGKKAISSKRIILFSNLREAFIADHLYDIIAAMKESCFCFNYIGPCFDDAMNQEKSSRTNGDLKSSKSFLMESRDILNNIFDETSGEHFSLSEILPCLSFLQSRSIRSTAWKASLRIGTSLDIPICLYVKVKEMKAKSFKNTYASQANAGIERSRSYHLIDDEETEIDKNDVIEGYRYGSTLVPLSSDDKEAMRVKSEKCLKVLGFTKLENVKRHQYVGDSVWTCMAERDNEVAQITLSALINALHETSMVAIVRRVYANGGVVKIGCLFPHIKTKYECLLYVELPFAEDLHQSTFKSLPDSVGTKKYALTGNQLDAVEKLIDSMDLCPRQSEEEESYELFKPKNLFNPYLQHLFQCIEHKVLHPGEQLPKLSPIISESFQPPKELVESSKQPVGKLTQLFELKTIAEVKAEDTTTLNDFIATISKSKNLPEACVQVHKKMSELDGQGILPENLEVFDCLRILRNESLKCKMSRHFNDMLHDLKKSLSGNNKNIFLLEISKKNMGIITKNECSSSPMGIDEAADFFRPADTKVDYSA